MAFSFCQTAPLKVHFILASQNLMLIDILISNPKNGRYLLSRYVDITVIQQKQ